ERDALAEAVAWSARSLPARPAAPVLAGLLLEVADDQLSISGFDYEVSTQAQLEVTAGAPGRALVSGRLLADIARALPGHPVEFSADGSGHHQLRQLPVHPADHAGRGLPEVAGSAEHRRHGLQHCVRPGGVAGRDRRRPGRHAADADR